jgi:hypothetical protein
MSFPFSFAILSLEPFEIFGRRGWKEVAIDETDLLEWI